MALPRLDISATVFNTLLFREAIGVTHLSVVFHQRRVQTLIAEPLADTWDTTPSCLIRKPERWRLFRFLVLSSDTSTILRFLWELLHDWLVRALAYFETSADIMKQFLRCLDQTNFVIQLPTMKPSGFTVQQVLEFSLVRSWDSRWALFVSATSNDDAVGHRQICRQRCCISSSARPRSPSQERHAVGSPDIAAIP